MPPSVDPAVRLRSGLRGHREVMTSMIDGTPATPGTLSSRTGPARPWLRQARRVPVVWAVALLAVGLRLPLLSRPPSPDEAGFLLVGGQWHSGGTSLYGDYWVDRPPLLITLFRIAADAGGLVPLRLLGCLATVLTILGAAHLARRLGGRAAAGWAALAAGVLLVSPADRFPVGQRRAAGRPVRDLGHRRGVPRPPGRTPRHAPCRRRGCCPRVLGDGQAELRGRRRVRGRRSGTRPVATRADGGAGAQPVRRLRPRCRRCVGRRLRLDDGQRHLPGGRVRRDVPLPPPGGPPAGITRQPRFPGATHLPAVLVADLRRRPADGRHRVGAVASPPGWHRGLGPGGDGRASR